VITGLAADVIQTTGTSSLSATVTPGGTGAINFTKTGNVVSGPNAVAYTPGLTDLTVNFENFTKGANSDASSVLDTIEETHVPEPSAVMLLGTGMLGLAFSSSVRLILRHRCKELGSVLTDICRARASPSSCSCQPRAHCHLLNRTVIILTASRLQYRQRREHLYCSAETWRRQLLACPNYDSKIDR
jgi:hypothetical protein